LRVGRESVLDNVIEIGYYYFVVSILFVERVILLRVLGSIAMEEFFER